MESGRGAPTMASYGFPFQPMDPPTMVKQERPFVGGGREKLVPINDVHFSREQMNLLCELYEREDDLWNMTKPEYRKKDARQRALERIVLAMNGEFTVEQISTKLNNIRSYYTKELQKINRSIKNATCPQDIYRSKWIYFPVLDAFLRSQVIPRKAEHQYAYNAYTHYLEACEQQTTLSNDDSQFMDEDSEDMPIRDDVTAMQSREDIANQLREEFPLMRPREDQPPSMAMENRSLLQQHRDSLAGVPVVHISMDDPNLPNQGPEPGHNFRRNYMGGEGDVAMDREQQQQSRMVPPLPPVSSASMPAHSEPEGDLPAETEVKKQTPPGEPPLKRLRSETSTPEVGNHWGLQQQQPPQAESTPNVKAQQVPASALVAAQREERVHMRRLAAMRQRTPARAEEDDDDLFARYLATEMRKITDQRVKNMMKLKVQSIVFEAQYESPALASRNQFYVNSMRMVRDSLSNPEAFPRHPPSSQPSYVMPVQQVYPSPLGSPSGAGNSHSNDDSPSESQSYSGTNHVNDNEGPSSP